MGWDVMVHTSAGVLALVLGGLMLADGTPWLAHVFSLLMVITFVSSVVISWWTASWVRGHFLAMTPVLGIGLGYAGYPIGFVLAYGLLCLAFAHFVYRVFVPPSKS